MKTKKLLLWAKPYLPLVVITILLTIINPLTYSYVPQFIRYVINGPLKANQEVSVTLPSFFITFVESMQSNLDKVITIGITIALFQIFRAFLNFLQGYLKGLLGEKIQLEMRNKMFSHIQNLSYSFHNQTDCGDLIQRCTSDIEMVKTFLSNDMTQIIYIIFSLLSGAIQMWLIDYRIALITFVMLPIILPSSYAYFKYSEKKYEDLEQKEADMTSVIQENVNSVRVVKAFNSELNEIKKFDNVSKTLKDDQIKINNVSSFFWGFSDCICFMQYAITMTMCIILAKKGIVETGDIVSALMYIGMLVWPLRDLGRLVGTFGKTVVSSQRIYEILDVKDEYETNGTIEPTINGNIEFKNVSFKFEDSEEYLFKNISFKILEGEQVAIVGKTGCGKSTICNLLTRMYEIEEGDVFIDDINIKEIEKHHLRNKIGYILQDAFLYAKSIYENVKIADAKINEEDVYKATNISRIHNDILEFDKGYKTLVGEKGVTLSGGQKQRISIARMIALNKPIMIFDDSLSAVDTKTDIEIRRELKKFNKKLTSIIVTHRITTAKECDKIIVINKGKIEAIGNHNELVEKSELYKQLWDLQGNLETIFEKEVGMVK